MAPRSVLDASALLAYLQDEDGADAVAEAISHGAAISTINLAEVLSTAAGHGHHPRDLAGRLVERGLLGGALSAEPFTDADALLVAELRGRTRRLGLSLADRACLALAQRLALPVLSSDRAWADADVPVSVRLIR